MGIESCSKTKISWILQDSIAFRQTLHVDGRANVLESDKKNVPYIDFKLESFECCFAISGFPQISQEAPNTLPDQFRIDREHVKINAGTNHPNSF